VAARLLRLVRGRGRKPERELSTVETRNPVFARLLKTYNNVRHAVRFLEGEGADRVAPSLHKERKRGKAKLDKTLRDEEMATRQESASLLPTPSPVASAPALVPASPIAPTSPAPPPALHRPFPGSSPFLDEGAPWRGPTTS
jgi:hypothetical protein